jgi:hypothetical protein
VEVVADRDLAAEVIESAELVVRTFEQERYAPLTPSRRSGCVAAREPLRRASASWWVPTSHQWTSGGFDDVRGLAVAWRHVQKHQGRSGVQDEPATDDEIYAAATQYVRKVSGYREPSRKNTGSASNPPWTRIAQASRKLLESVAPTA